MGSEIPLMLHESFALRIPGISRADAEAAKRKPRPCPRDWPVGQRTWMIYTPIPSTKR